MSCLHRFLAALILVLLPFGLLSSGSNNPSAFRVLTSIAVSPLSADIQNYPSGQVPFTATGTFSLPPSPSPVPSTSPYSGTFTVDNAAIATIVSVDAGTATVECVSGASGTVNVIATASANNGRGVMVSGSGQLVCH
jgi:hypothetical protein